MQNLLDEWIIKYPSKDEYFTIVQHDDYLFIYNSLI